MILIYLKLEKVIKYSRNVLPCMAITVNVFLNKLLLTKENSKQQGILTH